MYSEKTRRWCSGLESSPRKRKVWCSNPYVHSPKSLKQVVTAPLTSECHGSVEDDHYKRMPRVTVGVHA